jgi:3-methyladenine DNA glycosylase AlkD
MQHLSPAEYFQNIHRAFQEQGDPDTALSQMAYMRNQFEYFGLKMPAWMAITKQFHKIYRLPSVEDLPLVAELCFDDEHRELHYFAIETVQKMFKKLPAESGIALLEMLILEKSWWDTVDWIAKLVGMHFRRYPELIRPTTERWVASNNIWLQRVSIIFQLFYRKETDTALLFDYILRLSHSKEFFIQKASGWALRQHAKTDPIIVSDFVEQHRKRLAPLTVREGMKRR